MRSGRAEPDFLCHDCKLLVGQLGGETADDVAVRVDEAISDGQEGFVPLSLFGEGGELRRAGSPAHMNYVCLRCFRTVVLPGGDRSVRAEKKRKKENQRHVLEPMIN